MVKEINVIPEPLFSIQKSHSYTFSKKTRFYFENIGQNTAVAKYIVKSARKMHFRPTLVGKPSSDCITFRLYDTVNLEIGNEGYLLEVRTDGIHISANTETGLFYGYQTLLQLCPDDISQTAYSHITLPECTILDYPHYAWRGSHLDVSRHFFSVKEIKKHLDLMAAYKLNKFHWHLSDDHGWRVEIAQYPQLASVSAWRPERRGWDNDNPPRQGEPATYGGYYTQDDIRDIVAYAANLHIEVIPEFEIPGHCSAILAAYPQLSCNDSTYPVQTGPYWPSEAILCAGNDSVVAFIENIIDELLPLFPSEYYHIGGDETIKDNWESCPKCQARMHKHHLKNHEQLQGWLVRQIEDYLVDHGKKALCWDEQMEAGANNESVVLSWKGSKAVLHALRRGHSVVVASPEYCGFDYYQADPQYQPPAMPYALTLSRAYSFEPTPTTANERQKKLVLGARANLYTEFVEDYSSAEYMLLPRLCAFSEALWTPKEVKNWSHFRKKIEYHKKRLANMGYNCCNGSFKPTVHQMPESDTSIRVALELEVLNTYLFYTTDGSEPTQSSPIYVGPMSLRRGTLLRTLSVYNGKVQEGVFDFLIE